ncbi:NUDIX hydrolase [Frankia sp. AgB32]|uniref:NUDIX domain-containing protein n=1 Tax=Frankia sp. AgB32 TaxID=631119 RepID=UPI00200E72FB|nr:NUDIX hydrolase [Frankia sp. AgB32]MCK9896786.1 NUDIX hydrolase [Frankia sp. AgB32]
MQRTSEVASAYPVGGEAPTVTQAPTGTQAAAVGEFPPMARPYAAAGALFFDDDGRVLLVEPSYKPGWDIPGGFVEPGESPYAACVREVEEELGITPPIGGLLAVDWAPRPKDGWLEGEMLLFVFDGGLLPATWRERIQLDMNELVNFAFVPVAEVGGLLPPLHARRVTAAAGLRCTPRRAGYLEYGDEIPARSADRGAAPGDSAPD